MIPLRLQIEMPLIEEPMIVRLRSDATKDERSEYGYDAILTDKSDDWLDYDVSGLNLRIKAQDPLELNNDVLMILPGAKSAHRLVRAKSNHNTFLVTEQCDQLCIMCSQPPKPRHADLFDNFVEAACLAPKDAVIGISGGEPLLHKERLFYMLSCVNSNRPDLRFHVLTNGQHFEGADREFLSSEAGQQILWAIPIYSANSETHDRIVAKLGAFERLIASFELLSRTTAAIEIRTVLMTSNQQHLPELGDFITRYLPFVDFWCIMQMERIGYGKMNWETEFFDSSHDFENIGRSINILTARNMDVRLYNFPLCTVPTEYRKFAESSISDWKQKYLPICDDCSLKQACGGFFEWYRQIDGFRGVGAI